MAFIVISAQLAPIQTPCCDPIASLRSSLSSFEMSNPPMSLECQQVLGGHNYTTQMLSDIAPAPVKFQCENNEFTYCTQDTVTFKKNQLVSTTLTKENGMIIVGFGGHILRSPQFNDSILFLGILILIAGALAIVLKPIDKISHIGKLGKILGVLIIVGLIVTTYLVLNYNADCDAAIKHTGLSNVQSCEVTTMKNSLCEPYKLVTLSIGKTECLTPDFCVAQSVECVLEENGTISTCSGLNT